MKPRIQTIILLTGLGASSSASALVFPDNNFVRYGDFRSYSLPILDRIFPGEDFTIDSSPGQLQTFVKIYTGSTGNEGNDPPVSGGALSVDNAYPSPSGAPVSSLTMSGLPDPGADQGEFDVADTWDITLAALAGFLSLDDADPGNDSDLFFFFNHNETRNNQRDLFAWGEFKLVDDSTGSDTTGDPGAGNGSMITFNFTNDIPGLGGDPNGDVAGFDNEDGSMTFTLSPDPTVTFETVGGVHMIDAQNQNDWIYVPATVCLDPVAGVVSCDGRNKNTVEEVPHNLGSNDASFAITAPEINAILQSMNFGGYDFLRVDLRLADLHNGFEQFFIDAGNVVGAITPPPPPVTVPEPNTVALLGLGVLGIGFASRGRTRK